MKHIIVIGGGAAGLMAAVSAAAGGARVTVLEKMPSVGRKLLLTGNGRCNVTNSGDVQTHIKNMPGNGAFLHSALRAFGSHDLIDFLARQGVPTKVERGGRVFPASDKAADVVNAFLTALRALDAILLTGQAVKELIIEDGAAAGVVTRDGRRYDAAAVIVATGGASYPGTGSTGDGYAMAKQAGHTIIPLRPSLVPLEVAEEWIGELQGLALKNVSATVLRGEAKVAEAEGEMLFTHFGLSGPLILSLSNTVSALLAQGEGEVFVAINLMSALAPEEVDKRLQRQFANCRRKQIKNALADLLPARLVNVVIDLAFLDPEKPVHQTTKNERARLANAITGLTFTITGTRPLAEAMVTAGGVSTKEINPKTMESKLIKGLYFAGEVIDIDGYTGGFNLQAAFSTGYVAGRHAARQD